MTGKKFFYGWVTLVGAALVYFVEAAVIAYPFGIFLPFISDESGWSRGEVSVAPAMSYFVAALFTPFIGWFVAKYGAKKIILIGGVLCSLGLLMMSFHSQLWQLYFAYAVFIGLGTSFAGLVPTTTLAANWFIKKRSLALGIITASGSLGAVLILPAIAPLIGMIGWRATYLVLFIVALVCMALLPWMIIVNRPEEVGQVPDGKTVSVTVKPTGKVPVNKVYQTPVSFTVEETIRNSRFWLLLAAWGTVMFSMGVMVTHTVAFLLDLGISASTAATVFSFMPAMSVVGKLGIGYLGTRVNAHTLALGSSSLMALTMTGLLMTESLYQLFAMVTLFGFGFGGALVSFLNSFPAYFGRESCSKIMGISLPFTMFMMAAGAPFAGFLFDFTGSYVVPFSMLVVVLAAGLGCLLLAKPPVHPSLREALSVK